MSYAPPKAGRHGRIVVAADPLSARLFTRRQVYDQLDAIGPAMVIHSGTGRVNNYVRQYVRERRITNVEYHDLKESTIVDNFPHLMVVFPGGVETANTVKAAQRNHCPVFVVGR